MLPGTKDGLSPFVLPDISA
jgi:hypothetical protein